MEEKNNKKIAMFILLGISLLMIIVGFVMQFMTKSSAQEKRDSAESILADLSIDNYLKLILNSSTEVNKNLLDINSVEDIKLYFYSSKNLKHYNLEFLTGLDKETVTFVYSRYDEYLKFYQKVFNKEANLTIDDRDLSIADIVQVDGDNYKMNSGSVGKCDIEKPNECYIMLSKYIENNNTIKLSNLVKDNSIINGTAKVTNPEETIEATFKFEFSKTDNNYIIQSLKITSIK